MATSVSPGSRVPEFRPGLGPIAFLGDTALAALVAAGDRRAFEVVYERHRRPVFRYCSAITPHPQDAEEAFGLTMLSACRALSAGRPPRGDLTPWLLRIAHDECMDLLRARPRVEGPAGRDDPGVGVRGTAGAGGGVRRLRAGIAALPLRRRSALVLHEVNGLSYAAVAGVLGTDEDAARTVLHEARTGLAGSPAGRDPRCTDVRRRIGEGDRRTPRARAIRAHLCACGPCAAVAAAQDERRRRLAAWWPVLPTALAAEILRGILVGAETAAAGAGARAGTGAATGPGATARGGRALAGVCAVGVIATVAMSVAGVGPFAPDGAGPLADTTPSAGAADPSAPAPADRSRSAATPATAAPPVPIAAAAASTQPTVEAAAAVGPAGPRAVPAAPAPAPRAAPGVQVSDEADPAGTAGTRCAPGGGPLGVRVLPDGTIGTRRCRVGPVPAAPPSSGGAPAGVGAARVAIAPTPAPVPVVVMTARKPTPAPLPRPPDPVPVLPPTPPPVDGPVAAPAPVAEEQVPVEVAPAVVEPAPAPADAGAGAPPVRAG